jgi:hypothetical protein
MGYYDSLPPSFGQKVFSNESGSGLSSFNFASTYNGEFTGDFGVDTAGQFNSVADALSGTGALANGGGWTFITAPEDISWDVANSATRVDTFGTNNPPVVAGSRGMRDLTLGNALVEGFVRNVQVEGKIAALENLMNYSLNASDGFVSVPVYQVWANNKSYGGSEAYYIIKDVKVKEAMRDLTGNATRAYVDISLMQVPAYQVNSGRDQANQTTSGSNSLTQQQQAAQQAGQTGATSGTLGAGQSGSNAGPNAGGPAQTAKPATPTPSTRPKVTVTSSGQPEIKYVPPPR